MTVNASQPHCESCGKPRQWTPENEGYTECCGERICDGGHAETWAVGRIDGNDEPVQTGTVRGCCSAVAQTKTSLEVLHRVH